MKKQICVILCAAMICALTACGGQQTADSGAADSTAAAESSAETEAESVEETAADSTAAAETGEWTREGYFQDADENFLSVTWMDVDNEKGWYVGFAPGEESYGGFLPLEDGKLTGTLEDMEGGALKVTVAEEGEDGLMLETEDGTAYHFSVLDIPEATIFVNVNVEGRGNIEYAEGETAPEIDEEYPYQSAVINLAEPTTYTLLAWPEAGWQFVKWTKDGADFSEEALLTLELAESAEYIAVFEPDEKWAAASEAISGEYVCDRAQAQVDIHDSSAFVAIQWGGSATEMASWVIMGDIDPETLTVEYTDAMKSQFTYKEDGSVEEEIVEYSDGTGTITFKEDGSGFTWHDDKSDGEDLVFEKAPSES